MMDLKGKVVVITGGTSGIGLAIVKRLLNTDIKVIALFELDTPNSRKVVKDLEKIHNARIQFYPCDVSNTYQLEGNFEDVFRKYKTVNILINNAGIGTEENSELMIDVNYKAVVLGSLMMVKRIGKHRGGEGGIIVNIASTLGLKNEAFPVYCSSKHAVVSFTRTMQQHYETTGVRMSAICPGLTDTPIIESSNRMLDFNSFDMSEMDDLKKQSPDNVAAAVIKVIQEDEKGTVWIVDNDQPPFEVEERPELDPLKSNL